MRGEENMDILKYGNTNTFFIKGNLSGVRKNMINGWQKRQKCQNLFIFEGILPIYSVYCFIEKMHGN